MEIARQLYHTGAIKDRIVTSLMSTHGKVEGTMGLCRGDVGFGITLMSAMSW